MCVCVCVSPVAAIIQLSRTAGSLIPDRLNLSVSSIIRVTASNYTYLTHWLAPECVLTYISNHTLLACVIEIVMVGRGITLYDWQSYFE